MRGVAEQKTMRRREDERARDASRERDVRIRAFFAVEMGEAARRAAAELARALRDAPGGDAVRWVRAENLHVTLRFLGPVEPARVPELVARVREEVAGTPPFELALGRLESLSGRVLVLALEPRAPLAALAGAVERGVVAAGLPPESRPFRGHLTLGRLRGRRLPTVTAAVTPGRHPFPVREAVLFQSRPGPGGSQYTALERIALEAA